jgi:hypothetical protein
MSEEEPKPDLSFVTTEQLITELMERHDGLLVVRESHTDTKGTRSEVLFDFSGGVSRCLGLAERMKHYLLTNNWNAKPEDVEE